LTWHGKLVPEAFVAMARAQAAGLRVVPITGRPGGWVDHLARMWPVDGVIGENGGLWFYIDHGRMVRGYLQSPEVRRQNRVRLEALADTVLARFPGTALASDQHYRDLDVAVDFCEDVPRLPEDTVWAIAEAFRAGGATSKVSSIHVNAWFGDFDKLVGCRRFLRERFDEDLDDVIADYAYFGDSANDEPMFEAFPLSVGVANVAAFLPRMRHHPSYLCEGNGGHGFAEALDHILAHRRA
jgi:HAD superfamily hydrolase (TIGR01484 family)